MRGAHLVVESWINGRWARTGDSVTGVVELPRGGAPHRRVRLVRDSGAVPEVPAVDYGEELAEATVKLIERERHAPGPEWRDTDEDRRLQATFVDAVRAFVFDTLRRERAP